jgi:sugar phosphate permease
MRWTGYGLMVVAFVLAFFHRNSPAAMAEALAVEWHAGPALLGTIAASYFWAYTAMQVPTGILADRLGPRRIVSLGMAAAGVGTVLFALAPDAAWGAVARMLIGFGVSFPFISLLKFAAVWFPERQFATISGLTVFIGNIGAVLAATPLVWVMHYLAWQGVFLGLGAATLVLAAVTWHLVYDRPEHAGLPPVHAPTLAEDCAGPHWRVGLMQVLRNRRTWPGFVLNFGLAGGAFGFAGLWGVPFLEGSYGMGKAEAAAQTSLLVAACAVGGLVIGRISDALGRRRPVMLAWTLAHTLLWLPWLLHWRLAGWQHSLLSAALGFTSAAFALTWAVAKEVNAPRLAGMAAGVVNTGAFLGGAVIQQALGFWVEWRTELVPAAAALHEAVWLIPLTCAAGVVAAWCVTETYARNISLARA